MQYKLELRGEVKAGHGELSGWSQVHELKSGKKIKGCAYSRGCDDKDNHKIIRASMY